MALGFGITEVDLHGMTVEAARVRVEREVAAAGVSVYRIRLIHGFHGGTGIRSMIQEEFGYGREPKVLRILPGSNPGITELVLREL